MRLSLFLLAVLAAAPSCKEESLPDERWLESTQRQEVIVFKDVSPLDARGGEQRFYFQSRKQPENSSLTSSSGFYYYSLEGDSLLLNNTRKKVFFRMDESGRSFTIGRFFPDPGGLPELLIFEKQ